MRGVGFILLFTLVLIMCSCGSSDGSGSGRIVIVNNSSCTIPIRVNGGDEILLVSTDVYTLEGVPATVPQSIMFRTYTEQYGDGGAICQVSGGTEICGVDVENQETAMLTVSNHILPEFVAIYCGGT